MWKFGYLCSILAGIYILGATVLDLFNGYVYLPNRFRDGIQVYPEDGIYFIGILGVWVLGGLFLIGLGIYGVRQERKS